jgi:hypothetical protein
MSDWVDPTGFPGEIGDEPRWDHRAHYDHAMRMLDAPGVSDTPSQAALVHMLGAVYRLLEERL